MKEKDIRYILGKLDAALSQLSESDQRDRLIEARLELIESARILGLVDNIETSPEYLLGKLEQLEKLDPEIIDTITRERLIAQCHFLPEINQLKDQKANLEAQFAAEFSTKKGELNNSKNVLAEEINALKYHKANPDVILAMQQAQIIRKKAEIESAHSTIIAQQGAINAMEEKQQQSSLYGIVLSAIEDADKEWAQFYNEAEEITPSTSTAENLQQSTTASDATGNFHYYNGAYYEEGADPNMAIVGFLQPPTTSSTSPAENPQQSNITTSTETHQEELQATDILYATLNFEGNFER